MLASLFFLATARSNGWVLWTLPFNWNPVCQRTVTDLFLLDIVGSDALYNQKDDRPTHRQIEKSGGKQK